MNYNQLFKDLEANSSRLYKEKKLLEYQNDSLLRDIFKAGLDPFINYWQRKIPSYESSITAGITLRDALAQLYHLSDRTYTGHAGIGFLQNILECLGPDDAQVIEKIIKGDFRCGVSRSTVNKVWPNLIPEYPVMLASASDEKLLNRMTFPAYAQLKMDGLRFNAIVYNGAVEFRGRSGKAFDFLGNLEKEFLEMANGKDIVYDGELWVDDGNGKPMARSKGNGICSKALKGTIGKAEAELISVTLWDCIEHSKWLLGKDLRSYRERLGSLTVDVTEANVAKYPRIQLIEQKVVNSLDEANVVFGLYLEDGQEGIILKKMDSIWEDTRSKDHVKFKAEVSADMQCVGWEFGTGKYKDKIGNLILQTSDGLIECSVGSGLNDKDRDKPGDYYLDKVIEIVYNTRIKSRGDKKESLFLPRFICVRFDKEVANSSRELI